MSAPLVVLEYVTDPRTSKVDNPYTALLSEALEAAGVVVVHFSWRRALIAKSDVHHIHWPEQLVRHASPRRRLAKSLLGVLLVLRLRLMRIPVVRTVHNTRPHDGISWFEKWFLGWIDRLTVEWIVMNEVSMPPASGAHLVVHGHYRSWFPPQDARPVPGRLIAFGLLRPYKGFDRLVSAFAGISDPGLRLHVMGSPASSAISDDLAARAASDPRVTLDLRFMPDEVLVEEISRAEAVVLPYRDMNNSGAVLLALSCHRPVIVPDTAATRLMESEFGAEWVCRVVGDWTSSSLQDCLSRLRLQAREPDGPNMSSRDWGPLGVATAEILRLAVRGAV